MSPPRIHATAVVLATLLAFGLVPAASADHSQPARDISKLDYTPEGFFKAGDAVPLGNACETTDLFKTRRQGTRFNPSGKYNAFDNDVYEVFCLPFRNADDMNADDEFGGGTGSDPARLLRQPRHKRPATRPGGSTLGHRRPLPEPPARVHRLLRGDDARHPWRLRRRDQAL